MEDHFELADSEFLKQFKNCELDPLVFNHEAHLRLAWLHIHTYGIEKAIKNVQIQLKYEYRVADIKRYLVFGSLIKSSHQIEASNIIGK